MARCWTHTRFSFVRRKCFESSAVKPEQRTRTLPLSVEIWLCIFCGSPRDIPEWLSKAISRLHIPRVNSSATDPFTRHFLTLSLSQTLLMDSLDGNCPIQINLLFCFQKRSYIVFRVLVDESPAFYLQQTVMTKHLRITWTLHKSNINLRNPITSIDLGKYIFNYPFFVERNSLHKFDYTITQSTR